MFSMEEKKWLAAEVEKLVLSLKHPEMPEDKPMFTLRVEGAESWSWAEIKPNWTFGKEGAKVENPWNEMARKVMDLNHAAWCNELQPIREDGPCNCQGQPVDDNGNTIKEKP